MMWLIYGTHINEGIPIDYLLLYILARHKSKTDSFKLESVFNLLMDDEKG